jgi:hypothetical protein
MITQYLQRAGKAARLCGLAALVAAGSLGLGGCGYKEDPAITTSTNDYSLHEQLNNIHQNFIKEGIKPSEYETNNYGKMIHGKYVFSSNKKRKNTFMDVFL